MLNWVPQPSLRNKGKLAVSRIIFLTNLKFSIGGNIKMEDEKEIATEREKIITDVTLKERNDCITKVIMLTKDGDKITFRPKKKKTSTSEFLGMVTEEEKSEPLPKSEAKEVLEKFAEIKKVIDNKQECKIVLTYFVWKQEVDGGENIYRFIQQQQLDEMKILSSEKVKEEVVE